MQPSRALLGGDRIQSSDSFWLTELTIFPSVGEIAQGGYGRVERRGDGEDENCLLKLETWNLKPETWNPLSLTFWQARNEERLLKFRCRKANGSLILQAKTEIIYPRASDVMRCVCTTSYSQPADERQSRTNSTIETIGLVNRPLAKLPQATWEDARNRLEDLNPSDSCFLSTFFAIINPIVQRAKDPMARINAGSDIWALYSILESRFDPGMTA